MSLTRNVLLANAVLEVIRIERNVHFLFVTGINIYR